MVFLHKFVPLLPYSKRAQVSCSVTLAPLYNLIRVVSCHPLPQVLSKIALGEGLGVQLKW